MNVYDFAMKMELDGKAYYEKLAAAAKIAGLRNIFQGLAEDEQKHYEIFQGLKNQASPIMAESTALENARNVFEKLIAEKSVGSPAPDELAGYQHAMKLEAESYRFYEEAAIHTPDPGIKQLLSRIAGEERKHFNILQNVFDFVNAPNQFLAWAEFSNLDEFRNFGRDVDNM